MRDIQTAPAAADGEAGARPGALLRWPGRLFQQGARRAARVCESGDSGRPSRRRRQPSEAMAGNKRKSSAEKQPKHRLPLGADADMLAAASKLRHKGAAKLHQADQEASIPSSLGTKILH
nr:unnamed protein product [Digitaria exilis]